MAKSSLILEKSADFSQNISNNIPGYDIDKLEFGAYDKDHFVTFFADMRGSTNRAERIGDKDTFLTIHAIMPAMIYVVQAYGGKIVDLPGDGVMALFKGNPKGIVWEGTRGEEYMNEETLAVRAGEMLLKAFEEVVNPILQEDEIEPVVFGVGIDTGDVIVTKVGTDNIRDIKAIGTSINSASKNCFGENEMFISPNTYKKINYDMKKGFVESRRPKDEVEGFLKKIY
nr:adenylate/guanylate cyclase domain-containing protein [Clostridium beijerinckii]